METKPNDSVNNRTSDDHEFCLTKREHFAALAIQGMLANPSYRSMSIDAITENATKISDKLIEQLNSKRVKNG